ncbi:DUF1932 domain-containing protein [Dehalococcoidia bacterium]|nr:DUF1932 domain-containing protein [Dehalococcoidia bacterium]
MGVKTVAIQSPGDMGHAVGKVLGENGFDVITCLAGRSERTKELAGEGNFRIVETMDDLVSEADLILSILVPGRAKELANEVSKSLNRTGATTYFADCNAVSPDTAKEIGKTINAAGGTFIDGGIIGTAPTKGDTPRFYVSGPDADVVAVLDGKGIIVKVVGPDVGQASGIKMCYAALTKGTHTLQVALLTAAQKMGLTEQLKAELEFSQQGALAAMESGISRLPANAHRWIGEMEEISSTFASLGVTPHFHMGAADVYKLLNETPFAQETPETIDKTRSTWDTISVAADMVNSPYVRPE